MTAGERGECDDQANRDCGRRGGGRFGGVSTSAKFLEHFTEGYPWAHLDIANVTWADRAPNAYTPAGATGYGVRLLVEFAQSF